MAKQSYTGKSFEYSIAKSYYDYLLGLGLNVVVVQDAAFNSVSRSFALCSQEEQSQFMSAANTTIASMIKLEPGLIDQKSSTDVLSIRIASDSEGQSGDVRDVIFTRAFSGWEIGFSVKNNHDAAKHSRLSPTIDFGKEWLGYPCSLLYFHEINEVFDEVKRLKITDHSLTWVDAFPNLHTDIYAPILKAFKKEILELNSTNPNVPQKLLSYLIGRNSFYKIIKLDSHNLVVVKGYNTRSDLGLKYYRIQPACKIPPTNLPTRIIELKGYPANLTSLYMTLDNGWQIKFRIHTAESKLITSLKFDVTLIGNPPILFTHYIFP